MTSVAVIKLGGSYLSAVYGIKDLLADAETHMPGTFEVSIVSGPEFARSRRRFDLVIIPPLRLPARLDDKIVASLRRASERGSCLCSVCVGAFYLCATGIADGESVTTHWRVAETLQAAYPAVKVRKQKILIDRGRFMTAGGITSYQDLCLHLIRRYAGLDAALATAGTFLLNTEDRSQLQYVSLKLNVAGADGDVAKAIEFIASEFGKPIGLGEIASHCGITVRTLLRRFRACGGCTPGEYLQTVRLSHAKTLLQSGTSSVKGAALASGYRDIVSFSRAFKKTTGLNPGEFGRRYRAETLPQAEEAFAKP